MPYLPSDAAKKSQLYSNIVNGDTLEYQNEIDDLKKKQQVSGSLGANTPLRDEDGILVSFESATAGISLEEDFEEVRLENKQFFFTGQIDNEFTHYFQPITEDTTTTTTTTDTTTTTEEVEFALTLRDYLIQVVNEYFAEELTPEVSTDKLHSKLNEFFKLEGPVGGARNTNGWKEGDAASFSYTAAYYKAGRMSPPTDGGGVDYDNSSSNSSSGSGGVGPLLSNQNPEPTGSSDIPLFYELPTGG